MTKTEGTIKVRNWLRIILYFAGLIGSGITTTIFTLALLMPFQTGSDLFVTVFLAILTFYNAILLCVFALTLFEYITNEKYFKEVEIIMD